jgi:hypothetical protein
VGHAFELVDKRDNLLVGRLGGTASATSIPLKGVPFIKTNLRKNM